MTSRTVVGLVLVGLLGCADAGGSSASPNIDERCPYAHAPGVAIAIYPEDTHVCVYSCRDPHDGGTHPAAFCGTECVTIDTAEHCGTCDRRCGGSMPYCDTRIGVSCSATRPTSTP